MCVMIAVSLIIIIMGLLKWQEKLDTFQGSHLIQWDFFPSRPIKLFTTVK